MNPNALKLDSDERSRLRSIRSQDGWPFSCEYKTRTTHKNRKRKWSALHVSLALVMLELGFTKDRIRSIIGFGEQFMDGISAGRIGNDRTPDELATGESYCPPTRCEGCDGAMITILPCRACKARAK
jgi:hypothetical protein